MDTHMIKHDENCLQLQNSNGLSQVSKSIENLPSHWDKLLYKIHKEIEFIKKYNCIILSQKYDNLWSISYVYLAQKSFTQNKLQ